MAFRRLLFSKPLFPNSSNGHRIASQAVTLEHKHHSLSSNVAVSGHFPEFLSLPVGEKLRERLMGINEDVAGGGDRRMRPEGLGVTVEDARKLMRVAQVERVKGRVKEEGKPTASYSEFVRISFLRSSTVELGFITLTRWLV